MIRVGSRVRVREVEVLEELDDVDDNPLVSEEMYEMAGGCYRVQGEDFWTRNVMICGWWFSPEMLELLEPITDPNDFIKLIKEKLDDDGKISLFALAETMEDEL